MDAQEIANRIALLWNPQPDMSGRQINRLHGRQRQLVEDLARDIADEAAAMLAAERERCAAVADAYARRWDMAGKATLLNIARSIRSLPPRTEGGEQ